MTRVRVVTIALTLTTSGGCDEIFDTGYEPPRDVVDEPPPRCFSETWDGTAALDQWNLLDPTNLPVRMRQEASVLKIDLFMGEGKKGNAITSMRALSLEDGAATATFDAAIGDANRIDFAVVSDDEATGYVFRFERALGAATTAMLYLQRIGGEENETGQRDTYLAGPIELRLRHDANAERVVYETRPPGGDWLVKSAASATAFTVAFHVRIGAFIDDMGGSGAAVVDDIGLVNPRCQP